MDQSYGATASNSNTHLNGGDWSPRISFSYSFACIQRVPSPNKKSSLHDSEFEFSRSISSDLLSADELFCDGKLRPLKLSSPESGKREWKASQRRQEVHFMEKKGAPVASDGNVPASSDENPIFVCKEDAIARWGRKTECNAVEAKSPTSREELISVCRRAEKVEIGKKSADSTSSTSRREDLLSASRMAEKLEDSKATTLRLRTSREGLTCACNVEMGGKAGKSESPTSRKELISVRKLEMGENAGKSRSPTSREEFVPAFKPEISSKAGKSESRTSREDAMFACKRVEKPELKGKAEEVKVPTSREDTLSTCSASRKCEKGGGTPVKWREEPLWAKRNEEEDKHPNSHLRGFSKHLRSASMILEGSGKHGNRSCVSLNNSRCTSPSRSFSLPATTPASPAASSSFSGFSSSSRYRSKIKDFFKLKKVTVTREDTLSAAGSSSSSACRLPISPRSLLAIFKSKESSKAGCRSSSSMDEGPQHAQEHVCASTKHVYGGGNKETFAKCKEFNPNLNKELGISSLTLPKSAKPPPPNPSFPFRFPPSSSSMSSKAAAAVSIDKTTQSSSTQCGVGSKLRAHKSHSFPHGKILGIEGPTMLVIDEGLLWEEGNNFKRSNNALNLHTQCPCPSGKEGSQRSIKKGNNNLMVVGSKGGQHGRAKGLERPLPYTSSVRVTPVLNVPSCITPSLRKTKTSSKPKAFSFDNLFGRRERAFIPPILKSSEG